MPSALPDANLLKSIFDSIRTKNQNLFVSLEQAGSTFLPTSVVEIAEHVYADQLKLDASWEFERQKFAVASLMEGESKKAKLGLSITPEETIHNNTICVRFTQATLNYVRLWQGRLHGASISAVVRWLKFGDRSGVRFYSSAQHNALICMNGELEKYQTNLEAAMNMYSVIGGTAALCIFKECFIFNAYMINRVQSALDSHVPERLSEIKPTINFPDFSNLRNNGSNQLPPKPIIEHQSESAEIYAECQKVDLPGAQINSAVDILVHFNRPGHD